jgi:hypothetical protein
MCDDSIFRSFKRIDGHDLTLQSSVRFVWSAALGPRSGRQPESAVGDPGILTEGRLHDLG